jgi:hypothetical protein
VLFKFFIFNLIFAWVSVSQASVWLSSSDVRFKQDVDLLNSSSGFAMTSMTWPIYLPDLHRALSGVDTDNLSVVQLGAFQRLQRRISQVRFRQLNGGAVKQIGLQGQTSQSLMSGFGHRAFPESDGGLSVTSERLNSDFAWKVQVLKTDEHSYLDESYVATSFAGTVLTLGAQSRWWSPGFQQNALWGAAAESIPGVHWQSIDSSSVEAFWQPYVKAVNWQLFAGQFEGATQPLDDYALNFYAGRLAFATQWGVDLGLSQLQFSQLDTAVHATNTLRLQAMDAQAFLSDWNGRVYGQWVQADDGDARWMLGASQWIPWQAAEGQLTYYVEYLDASESGWALTQDGQLSQNFGGDLGAGSQSLSLGAIWADDQGWLLQSSISFGTWSELASASIDDRLDVNLASSSDTLDYWHAAVSGVYYPSRHVKLEPKVFAQRFDPAVTSLDDFGASLKLSYLY